MWGRPQTFFNSYVGIDSTNAWTPNAIVASDLKKNNSSVWGPQQTFLISYESNECMNMLSFPVFDWWTFKAKYSLKIQAQMNCNLAQIMFLWSNKHCCNSCC